MFLQAIIAAAFVVATLGSKPYRLKILNFHDDGDGNYLEMGQLITERVNGRADILPDYAIEMNWVVEQYGAYAAAGAIEFYSESDDEDEDGKYYPSPIIIGPDYSSGGMAVASIAPYLHFVSICETCGAAVLSNHARFSNLYLNVETSDYTVLAILHFMKAVGWSQFALYTYGGNVNDYGGAMTMYQQAMEHGFTVTWFSIVLNDDETEDVVKTLLINNARIVVIFTSQGSFMYNFICKAYHLGITGPRYVFITTLFAVGEPFGMSDGDIPGCNMSVIYQQVSQSILAGQAMSVQNPAIVSELGYNQAEFAKIIMNMSRSSRPSDEPGRMTYHDSQLKAVFALHNAEEKLKKMNLSLRDYRRFPELVQKVANDSVLHINISGLHKARLTYNEAGLPEGEGHSISQWSTSLGLQAFATAHQFRISRVPTFDNYYIKMFRPINWTTPYGEQPRDFTPTLVVRQVVSPSIFVAIATTSILMIAVKIVAIPLVIYVKRIHVDMPFSQIINNLSYATLELSTICFVCDDRTTNSFSRWIAAITLLAIGAASSNGLMVFRAAAVHLSLSKTVRGRRKSLFVEGRRQYVASTQIGTEIATTRPSSHAAGRSSRALSGAPMSFSMNWASVDKMIVLVTLVFVTLNGTILIAWFLGDPIKCAWEFTDNPIYHPDLDVTVVSMIKSCTSNNMKAWMLGLTFLNVLILIAGNWLGYVVKQQHVILPEFNYIRLGLANAITLILGLLLVLIVLRSLIDQQIAIAFGTLIFSGLNSLINFLFIITPRAVH